MPDKSHFRPALAPWLSVNNGPAAVAFYQAAFGAVEVYRLESPDGGLVVRLAIGGAEFWVSGGSPEGEPVPEAVGGDTVRMVLTVVNPDVMFRQALAAGAKEVFPVSEDHGWRLGRLVDPFGLHWEVGRMLEEL